MKPGSLSRALGYRGDTWMVLSEEHHSIEEIADEECSGKSVLPRSWIFCFFPKPIWTAEILFLKWNLEAHSLLGFLSYSLGGLSRWLPRAPLLSQLRCFVFFNGVFSLLGMFFSSKKKKETEIFKNSRQSFPFSQDFLSITEAIFLKLAKHSFCHKTTVP